MEKKEKYGSLIALAIMILAISAVLAYKIPGWTEGLENWAKGLINWFFYFIALIVILSSAVMTAEARSKKDLTKEIDKLFISLYDLYIYVIICPLVFIYIKLFRKRYMMI